MSKSRLEAFSDGVIAIAITLLVLDIDVPAPHSGATLAHKLSEQWPSYAAYVVSFLTIGVIWINHHATFRRLRSVDHTVLMLNIVLLLVIGVLPWSTALMSEYLREDSGQHLAAALYAGSFRLMALAFLALQRYLMLSEHELFDTPMTRAQRLTLLRRNAGGTVPYTIAVACALLSPYLTLAICAAIAGFYALPGTTADP